MDYINLERFYKEDKKEYDIEVNTKFKRWLEHNQKSNYIKNITIQDINKTINFLTNWYEIKYPYDFARKRNNYILGYDKLITFMPSPAHLIINFNYAMSDNLLECGDNYFSGVLTIRKNIGGLKNNYMIVINIDPETGFINKNDLIGDLKKLNLPEKLTLNELIKILKNDDTYDCSDLKQVANEYNIRTELRKKVLELAALKMIYSRNSIPEHGYLRAKRFIEDFNENIPNLNLSIKKLEDFMNKEYYKKENINDVKIKSKILRKNNK